MFSEHQSSLKISTSLSSKAIEIFHNLPRVEILFTQGPLVVLVTYTTSVKRSGLVVDFLILMEKIIFLNIVPRLAKPTWLSDSHFPEVRIREGTESGLTEATKAAIVL